jgi:hypothetical protein
MSIECAFVGTLASEPKLKTSRNGKPYLSARVAVSNDDKTQWVGVIAFDPDTIGRRAELSKGSRIYWSLSEWQTPEGEKRHGLSLMAGFAGALRSATPNHAATNQNRNSRKINHRVT